MSPGVIFALVGGGQGLFLATSILLVKRGFRSANVLLGLLIFLFSLYVLEFSAYWTEFFFSYPHFLFLTVSFPLLFGPLLYLYVSRLCTGKKIGIKDFIHIIPFLLYVVYMMPFYLSNQEVKLEEFSSTIRSSTPNFGILFYILKALKVVQLLTYLVASVMVMYRSTTIQSTYLKWMKLLLFGFGLFALFDSFHGFQLYFYDYRNVHLLGNIFFIIGSATIYLFGYKIIQVPELLVGRIDSRTINKYERSSLTKVKAQACVLKLLKLMEEDKMYMDTDLNLSTLASSAGVSQHHVSQVLNDKMGKNFFDFVNEYRIEEAKSRLCDIKYQHLSIVGIAYDVGFKNKTSFNSAFNKHVGVTPSQYRSLAKAS